MLSSTSAVPGGTGEVAKLTKPPLVRRFMSAARDCARWPDPAHFALPCSVRTLASVRLTDLHVSGVPAGVDLVQLRVANLDDPHLVALGSEQRPRRWPARTLAGVSAQSWRILGGLPALAVGSVVEVPTQGLFNVVATPSETTAELHRPLRGGASVTEVRVASPLVAGPGSSVRTADGAEDLADVHPGDVLVVAGDHRLTVAARVSPAEVQVLPRDDAWDGQAAPYAVERGPQSDLTGALAALPVRQGACALDRAATHQWEVRPQQAGRLSELELRVTDAYGRDLAGLAHGAVEVELSLTEA